MMKQGDVVWITGASDGIGRELALQMADRGATLVLSARRQAQLEESKQLCVNRGLDANNVLVLPFDLADFDGMQARVDQVLEAFGRIDMLVNNGGLSQRSFCLETDFATYKTLMEVDVLGQIALTKAVLPVMVNQGSGHIAATASVAGKVGVALRTGYCAAKHAVMGFFDALRTEVARHNIRITTITPGFIRTNVAKNALGGDGKAMGKEDPNIAAGMDVQACVAVIMKGFDQGKPEIAMGNKMEMRILLLKRFLPSMALKIMRRMAPERYETT